MANTRFKGGTSSERLNYTSVSDADMFQLRHKPGTEDDTDKGISKASLVSCPFGVSETIAATAAKTASLTDSNPDFSLVSGREVVVYFSTANSANSPTLNFAGSGAAPMYYPDGSAVGSWAAGTWMHLKYFSATVGGVLLQRWILLSPGKVVDEVALNNMHSVTSNAVAEALSKRHYYHTTFFASAVNGWNVQTINFDKTYKYPPLVTVTIKDDIISPVSPDYWRDTLSPIFTVETTYVSIAYYVKDSHPFAYDVNVIGEID